MVFMCVEALGSRHISGVTCQPSNTVLWSLRGGEAGDQRELVPNPFPGHRELFCWGLGVLTFRVSDASWSLHQCTSQVALLQAVVGLVRV